MESLMTASPAPTHELIRLRTLNALTVEAPAPAWVSSALRRTPWVVVRRGYVCDGMLPVGVRGSARHERFAAWLALTEIADRLTPEDLIDQSDMIEPKRREEAPALAALARVAPLLASHRLRWGPGGSAGFEIATGVPTATCSSDLDLILRRDRRFAPGEAIDLLAAVTEAASPVQIDVMLETPCGGVSLADLAAMPDKMLVRTPAGPRLSADPWMVGAGALLEVGHDDCVPIPRTGVSKRGPSPASSATC